MNKPNIPHEIQTAPEERVRALFLETFGVSPEIEKLPAAGGDRKYYRLTSDACPSVIGAWSENLEENMTFVKLSEAFVSAGIHTPRVYASDFGSGICLQEDLGDVSLFSELSGADRLRLSEASLRQLADMQVVPGSSWRSLVMCGDFSKRQVMWDLNYFKYEFLKPTGIVYDENLLEDDFGRLAEDLMSVPESLTGFMYRDFQSRNVMIKDGTPYFIDFQGGRRGPMVYDVVSFLWQSRAAFKEDEKEILLEAYIDQLSHHRSFSRETFRIENDKMALFRTLQVLGAYGFRGLIEKRAHFILSIPGAVANLRQLKDKGVMDSYPELAKVAQRIIDSRYAGEQEPDGLLVKVFSFSYKKGYPEDLTGNGGGFMFDCRGLHNPGRYDEYKRLTGLDHEVIEFLESYDEVARFIGNAVEIVSPSVGRYRDRGFHNLQVGFGCTGGRHRSVYCAEKFAEKISRQYPGVKVRVIHREQDIIKDLGESI